MPNFNGGAFISFAIESVLKQTFGDFELIVVDDASTDDSVRIAQTYSNRCEAVRVIQLNRRGGSAAARNRGISEARGREICFLDSDDIYSSMKLDRQLGSLREESRPVMVYCDWWRIDEAGNALPPGKRDHPRKSGWIFGDALAQTFGAVSMCMVPRVCFDRVGLFDESLQWAEDFDLLLRLAREYEFKYVNQALYGYRTHERSKRKVVGRRERLLCESLVTEKHFQATKDVLDKGTRKEVISNLLRYYSRTGQNRKMLTYGVTSPGAFVKMLLLAVRHERID